MAERIGRTPMREQDPLVRAHNFEEVSFGYNEEEAMREAFRCLQCKNPLCVKGCPVAVQIPQFIGKIKEGAFDEAIRLIKETNALPAVCGRVCPQEEQCESKCVLGIRSEPVAIGRLERFAADYALAHAEKKPYEIKENGHKVAVVGAGPSGLTCAQALRQ
ncbi:MAG: dihydropyrimidine dehydrogenase, partial [Schwartzia sp.]|nr:dihydropyrimidine dehydrogenase [Schwartzia sp. (in: firmicutes)]